MRRSVGLALFIAAAFAAACGSRSNETARTGGSETVALSHGILFTARASLPDAEGGAATEQDLLDVLILAPGDSTGAATVRGVEWGGTPERRALRFDFVAGAAAVHGEVELIGNWELRDGGSVFDLRMGNLFVVRPDEESGFNVRQVRFVLKNGTDAATRLARFQELLPEDEAVQGLSIGR